MPRYTISVNDRSTDVDAAEDTPLLYVLANALGLKGPRLGCGLAQCGSCSVLINGVETRACVTPISDVRGKIGCDSRGSCRELRTREEACAGAGSASIAAGVHR